MNRYTSIFLTLTLLTLPQTLAAQDAKLVAGTQIESNFKTSDGADMGYLLYVPKDFDAEKKHALIFFLHGRGESNGPLSVVAKWGPPMMAARGDAMPYVIVSPQCPKDDRWISDTQQGRLLELLNSVVTEYPIDEQRIFLTGLSMGGQGSWTMAAAHPDRFAAVAPICGGGNPEDGDKLKNTPIWAFHGDKDSVVKFERTAEMVDAIKAVGGTSIRFTSYEHIGHNCWSATYATPELFQWMNQQGDTQSKEN